MHDAGASAWREIVEKSHARLIEELTTAVETDRRKAVDEAIAAERENAAAAVAAERQNADAALAAEQEKAAAALAAERESAAASIIAERERAAAAILAERQKADAALAAEQQKSAEAIAAERQKSGSVLGAEREKAAAAVVAERQKAEAALSAEHEKSAHAIAAEREKADAALAIEREIAKVEREAAKAELTAVREKANAEIAALRESLAGETKSRENVEKQVAAEMEKAGKLLAAERERANAELKSVREQSAADLKSAREQATAEMTKVSERAMANLNSARDQASAELNKVRAELTEAGAKSKIAARQAMAETLNQSLRRIRQASSVEATLQLAAELSSTYAHKAVVLVFEDNQARVAALHPAAAATAPTNGAGPDRAVIDLTLENAPALATAIETRDPVTVLARESEISPALARLLDAVPPEKVYLFPVVARQQVVAMLVVSGEVFPSAPELLAEAAGMRLEAITEVAKKTPPVESAMENLITIQRAAVPASPMADRRSWDELSPEDQKLHLQAQRVARVRVARMRLDREEAWRRGLAESDIYGALRRDIEAARTEFLQTFLSKSSTMVDYLHLEILRSLANEDDRVLGREYPGPMV